MQAGREPTPSAACIDTQSVKTTEVGGKELGYDGAKKRKGRQRHLLVDTLELLIMVVGHGGKHGRIYVAVCKVGTDAELIELSPIGG